jgi:tetratricopeptide (TPR) repeat protein
MVIGLNEADLEAAIDELVASGLVFRRGSRQSSSLEFKHALVRELAYETLVRSDREHLHAKIACCLEEHFPETVRSQPELLAHHHREGGHAVEAVTYLLSAAERSVLRSALTEALSHLTYARDLLGIAPAQNERLDLEIKLETLLARAFTARRSYSAPETRQAYTRARARCESLGNETWLPLVMMGEWLGAWSAADYRAALTAAEELQSRGKLKGNVAGQAVGHFASGMTLTVLGQLNDARRQLEAAVQIDQFALPNRPPFLFSDAEGRVSALTYLHDCLLLLGFPEKAAASAAEAEAAARKLGALAPDQLYPRALAMNHLLRMHVFQRDAHKAKALGTMALQLSGEQNYPYFHGTSKIHLGWALSRDGDHRRGAELCLEGIDQLQSIGANCWLPRYFALLAECHEAANDLDQAALAIGSALKSIQRTGERVWEAEIYRLKARYVQADPGARQHAEDWFRRSLEIAREQNAKWLELRAAMNFADLLARKGDMLHAEQVLSSVYGSFSEGFNHLDLQAAKTQLDNFRKAS